MAKCPLCGFDNSASAKSCKSCGANLEYSAGLVRDSENPCCFSYTPGRKLNSEQSFKLSGSGIDLIFGFSSDNLILPGIVLKVIILGVILFWLIFPESERSTSHYIIIPLLLLYCVSIVGWILIYRGGRKKKIKTVRSGMTLQYAFYSIVIAYMIMSVAVLIYFVVSIVGTDEYYGFVKLDSGDMILLFAILFVLVLISGFWLVIFSGFFKHALDTLNKNKFVYNKKINALPFFFFIGSLASLALSVALSFEMLVIDTSTLSFNFLPRTIKGTPLTVALLVLISAVWLIYGILIIRYIKTLKKYTVPIYVK